MSDNFERCDSDVIVIACFSKGSLFLIERPPRLTQACIFDEVSELLSHIYGTASRSLFSLTKLSFLSRLSLWC